MTSLIEEAKISYSVVLFRNALQYKDRVAIVEEQTGKTLTYAELISAVEKVSSALNKHGLHQDDIVSIVGPSCMEIVIVEFAVLSTGAAVTFAKPSFTEYELSYHYEDSRPRFVFTAPDLLGKVKNALRNVNSCERIFLLRKSSEDDANNPHETLEDLLMDDGRQSTLFDESIVKDARTHLAYLPYSSGTTGLPKAVMWSHYGLNCNHLNIKRMNYPKGIPKVYGLQSPLFHASGILVVNIAFTNGMKVIILPEFEPEIFLKTLVKYQVDCTFTVSHMIVALLKYQKIEEFDLTHLKMLTTGGASISGALLREFNEKLRLANSSAILSQNYGLTEACIIPTTAWYRGNQYELDKEESVGIPLPGTEMKVVKDDSGEAMGPYEAGHIWIRHSAIMLGYRNKKEATESTITHDGWLKTGDVGYYDEDGYYYIVGRHKELFHCNGSQVSPNEIEVVLQSHPSVKDAAVIGVPHNAMGEVAMAFVVKKDENLTENDLHQLIVGKLAPFKHLHGGIKFVDTIPRNSLGKPLRADLQTMLLAASN